MKPVRVLITDDEPLAIEILEEYLTRLGGFEIAGRCSNALEAFSLLNSARVDLLLLDINMPGLSGLDLLKALKDPPLVVFTTAYPQYAATSYDYNATDYLVKPIPYERFVLAMNKVRDALARSQVSTQDDAGVLFVRTEGRLVRVDVQDIWLVEGLKDYIRIWTASGKIVVHSTMKNIEQQLSTHPGFTRVHKSYIVNLRHVSEVEGNTLHINGQSLPIGATYKDQLHRQLQEYRLQ